jgi:hypothetical protein
MTERGIQMPELSEDFTQNELFFEAARAYNMSVHDLTAYLWDTYHPADIWWLFTGIGIATALLLFAFDRLLMRGKNSFS